MIQEAHGASLAGLTTTGVGGPARTLLEAQSEAELVEILRDNDGDAPLLVIAGGSNLIIGDEGFDGVAIHVASRGIAVDDSGGQCGGTFLTVSAGHPWDEVVSYSVETGLVGLESLSGIPGSAGSTPIQNVGAYGSDVSETLARIRVWDRSQVRVRTLANSDLGLGYRTSMLKRAAVQGVPRYVVLDVTFQLHPGSLSRPVRYQQLAEYLGVELGAKVPLAQLRSAVLELRAAKGMVYSPTDPDTHSTGSFFTNPIVAAGLAASLPEQAPRYGVGTPAQGQSQAEQVKLSAAWLISQAGFERGYGLPGTPGERITGGRASLSTKHSLAITNRGAASSADILALARVVRDGVEEKFSVKLEPEPVVVPPTLFT